MPLEFSGAPLRRNGDGHLPKVPTAKPPSNVAPTGRPPQRTHYSAKLPVAEAVILPEQIARAKPKPSLLLQIEQFLESEITRLGKTPSDVEVLSSYRNAFEIFAQSMPAFEPFLLHVLSEYERIVSHLQNEVWAHETKAKAVVVAPKIDDDIVTIGVSVEDLQAELTKHREEDKQKYEAISRELVKLRKDNRRLREFAQQREQEFAVEISAKQRDFDDLNRSLEGLTKQLSESESKLQELRLADAHTEGERNQIVRMEEELALQSRELVKLRVDVERHRNKAKELKRTNEKLANQNTELAARLQQFDDSGAMVVRQYAEAQQKVEAVKKQAEAEVKQMKEQLHQAVLAMQHEQKNAEKLQSACADLRQRAHTLQLEKEELTRFKAELGSPTNPSSSGSFSMSRRQSMRLSRSMSTRNMLNSRRSHATSPSPSRTGTVQQLRRKVFVGLGTGPDVPSYLRHVGRILNKELQPEDTIYAVRQLWRDVAEVQSSSISAPIEDLFREWLNKQYGPERQHVATWAYSLVEAVQTFQGHPELYLFWKVLNRELPVQVHEDLQQHTQRLLKAFAKAEQSHRGKGEPTLGWLEARHLVQVIHKTFPTKPHDSVGKLGLCLGPDPQAKIFYNTLFDDAPTGQRFLDCFRQQYIDELEAYYVEIKEAIIALVQINEKTLPLYHLREALSRVDPDRPPREVDKIVADVIGVSDSDTNWSQQIGWKQFLTRLRETQLLKRWSTQQANVLPDVELEAFKWDPNVPVPDQLRRCETPTSTTLARREVSFCDSVTTSAVDIAELTASLRLDSKDQLGAKLEVVGPDSDDDEENPVVDAEAIVSAVRRRISLSIQDTSSEEETGRRQSISLQLVNTELRRRRSSVPEASPRMPSEYFRTSLKPSPSAGKL